MYLDFLEASDGTALTKSFFNDDTGNLDIQPYPPVRDFISHRQCVDTIEEFYQALVSHSSSGHCLLKGLLDKPLSHESRAGHTDRGASTRWVVLDNDHLHGLEPQALLNLIGFNDVDHIVQYSASAGIVPDKMGYHLYVFLDDEYTPRQLKLWLKHLNLTVAGIREAFSLASTNLSLRWPIDISVCQNDKLIYITPAYCGPGVEDHFSGDRIQLVRGNQRYAQLDLTEIDKEWLHGREQKIINDLRQKMDLPPKEIRTRYVHNQDVVCNPDRAQVTGRREERGFVYLNINDGDSWAYFHPITNADILYNFKDEPKYLIRELLPDYYKDAKERAKLQKTEQERVRGKQNTDNYLKSQKKYFEDCKASGSRAYLTFRDDQTDLYYIGYHDYGTGQHKFLPTSSKDKARDYLKQYGQPKLELVETWDFSFQPHCEDIFDPDNRFINQFQPSEYMLNAVRKEKLEIPSNIQHLIIHVCGNDPKVVDRFLNWLAVIFQYRIRTQTAWIFQGTTGTGKGLLFGSVIRPLIGESYCRSMTLPNLEEQFNKFTEQCIVLFIDEVDTNQIRHMDKLIARLKNMITEPKISMRAMRTDLRETFNYLNIIMASNQPNSMRIEQNDRRFNVAPRQEEILFKPEDNPVEFISTVREELPEFADFLKTFPACQTTARTALDNEAKQQMQTITQTAIEEVVQAIITGDIDFFFLLLPDNQGLSCKPSYFDGKEIHLSDEYYRIMEDALKHCKDGKSHFMNHLDLYVLTEFLVGKMPSTKGRLKSLLGHQSIHLAPKSDGKVSLGRGYTVFWKTTEDNMQLWSKLLEKEKTSKTPIHQYPRAV